MAPPRFPAPVALVVASLLVSAAAPSAEQPAKPNILFLAADDLRPFLGCYGDERARTPNLDRLAKQSLLFERAYCNYAKCGPSRLSLMTGLRPGSVAVFNHRDSSVAEFRERHPGAVSMARWFRDHGYESRSFGKIDHDGWADPAEWSAPPFAGRDGEMLEVAPADNPAGPTVIAERSACPVLQSPDVGDGHLFAGRMTAKVIETLEGRDAAKPFFYAVGFRRPHLPFVAPRRYFDLHEPDDSWLAPNPEPPTGTPWFPWFNSDGYGGLAKKLGDPMPERMDIGAAVDFNGFEMRSYLGVPCRGEISRDTQLDLLQAYAACVSYVDAQVGKLLDHLEKSGQRDDTIVVFWSDHGWHLGELSAWGKMTNYEIANRVPLLLSAPGKERGRTRAIAELVDLYPTLCDLAGLDAPGHLEGESLVPVLDDPFHPGTGEARHEYVRYNGRYHGHALRTDRWRYVRWTNRKGEVEAEELYDLEGDPLETRNLAGEKPERADLLERRLLGKEE